MKAFIKEQFAYIALAIAIVSLAVFVVLPQLPQIESSLESVSTKAVAALAFGGGGGGGCGGCGDGGGGGDDGGGGGDWTPKPVCQISKSRSSIDLGESVKITWQSSYATAASLNGDSVAVDGNKTFTPNSIGEQTYTLVVTGSGGTDTCTTKVTVEQPPFNARCTDFGYDFKVAKAEWNGSTYDFEYTKSGYSVDVSNSASNANWTASPGVAGVIAKAATVSEEFAGGTSGTVKKSEIGTGKHDISHILWCGEEVEPEPLRCELGLSTSVINTGESTTLTWSTSGAQSVTIDQGIGSVANSGSVEVSPTENTTYTLTANDGKGNTVKCTATLQCIPPEEPKECELDITKTVNKTSATVGEKLTYTIKVKNIGDGDCTGGGVKIVDVVDGNIVFKSSTEVGEISKGYGNKPLYDASSRTLRWNGHTLTPGESGTITWIGEVTEPTQCGDFTVYNQAKTTAKELDNYGTWAYSDKVSTHIENDCPTPDPVCDFLTATPTSLPYGGGSVNLNWGTTNADSVTINNGVGSVAADGSTSVNVTEDITYTLTAISGQKSDQCTVGIDVGDPAPKPYCVIDANPESVRLGDSSVLTWTTTNADTAVIDQSIGSVVTGSGISRTVTPDTTTTYTMTVTGPGGTATCYDTVGIYIPELPACTDFTVTPDYFNNGTGGNVTLNWSTINTDTVSIDQGIGSVAANGSYNTSVSDDTTFTLTAGTGTDADQCTASVVVEEPEIKLSCDSFKSSESSVRRGSSFTLSWETTGADSVAIDNGIGSVNLDGSVTASIDDETTFTLTATRGSETVTCTEFVDITTGGGGGGSSKPRCDFEANKTRIKRGEEVVLSWDNTRTNDIILEDDKGTELINTDDNLDDDNKYDEDEDSITVKPTEDIEYTLTAIRGSRDDECTVDIEVEDEVTVIETRIQPPLVAGISLSNVPYTGFEAGPALTALFYTLLAAWSLFVAYLLVIRKTSVLGVSLASGATANEATTFVPQQVHAEPVVASTTAVADVPANLPTAQPAATGYEAMYEKLNGEASPYASAEEFATLENHAHRAGVLLSSDALRHIAGHTTDEVEQIELLDTLINRVKASYPSEDGWVVLNRERITALLGGAVESPVAPTAVPADAPVGASSLAEAIVTGNASAAQKLIGDNPLFSLTDAATDLNTLVQFRQGNHVVVSEMLNQASRDISEETLKSAIVALGSALDSAADENTAVKLAVMQAIKAVRS